MSRYINNAIADSMFDATETAQMIIKMSITEAQAKEWLSRWDVWHGGNPSHKNTWDAAAKRLGDSRLANPKGGKLNMIHGDELLVVSLAGLPRETREFTDEEVSKATMSFSLYVVK